jgi:hypothetical protein
MITLHDLNDPSARANVRDAPVVVFVNPHTGRAHVVAGAATVDAAERSGAKGVYGVKISVEDECHELEIATAAVLAIRGHVDRADAVVLRPLADTIGKYWTREMSVPWREMLTSWEMLE